MFRSAKSSSPAPAVVDGSGATQAPSAQGAMLPAFGGSGGLSITPAVNIFGEIGAGDRRPVNFVGEAGFQQHTFTTEGSDGSPQVDPTGKWLVYTSTRHQESPRLYLQRVDGTSVIQLTNGPGEDAYPAFCPAGKSVAFCSTRNGDWDIYVMDIDGRNVVQVTNGPSQDIHPSFSPDGSRLVYSSLSPRGDQWELWTVDLSTREKRMVGFGLFPRWSPSANVDRIAFQRPRQRGSRWFSVWTLDLIDGEARRVSEVAVSSNAAAVTPTWSPDGQRLAFTTIVDPGQTTAAGRPTGQQDIWVIDADGANRKRLTEGKGINLTPSWSSDGRVYFVSDRGGSECIWSARVEPSRTWTAQRNGGDRGANASIRD